jgi:phosphodiesterase/alkaline phosphatase D-like protein
MSARLLVSRSALLTSPTILPAVVSDTNQYNLVAFAVANLQPDTQYHYALEIDGRLDRRKRGAFRTFPAPGPASFKIAFASCGRTGSTRDVFDRIREHQPLFYMNMGDFHYQDIRTNRPALFRAAYDAVLGSPQQGDLYRSVPIVYMWDDHDYGGNNSNGKSTSHDAARATYEEYVPHYPFVEPDLDEPIYQTFTVGRVKFIISDLRSDRDDPKDKDDETKSLLGTKQKKWFKEQLLEANGKYPLILWMTSVPWIGERGKSPYRVVKTNQWGFLHHTNLVETTNSAETVAAQEAAEKAEAEKEEAEKADGDDKGEVANSGTTNKVDDAKLAAITSPVTNATNTATNRGGNNRGNRNRNRNPNAGGGDEDHWSAFATERREIADFIKTNHIRGVAILHGDSHMLAADDGSNADYATGGGAPIPVMCGGPLDQNPSLKGGPYSQGVYRVRDKEGESGFGLLTITDKGSHIEVVYSGRNNKDEEKISLKFSVPAQANALTKAK